MPNAAVVNEETTEERLPAGVWKIAAVAMLGPFLSQMDSTVVNVSLSSLAAELRSPLSTIQWVTSGYLLALALMLPLNGWLVDKIGAKRLYLWCFSTFTISSALCGMAWSAESLIGFRVLQGMSGGLLAPMAQMVLAKAAGKHLPRVFGYAAVPVILGPMVGPVVAGAILQHWSWRWLFLVNLPVGVLAVALAAVFLPDDTGEAKRRELDITGLLMLSPGLVLFLYSVDHISELQGRVVLVVAAALLGTFFWWARRKGDAALVDLKLFRGRTFAASTAAQFLSNGAMYAGQMLIPFFLIRACGRTPGNVGWLLMPMGMGAVCVYPLMGRITERWGVRKISGSGAAMVMLSTLPLMWQAEHGLMLRVLIVALFLRGMGQGMIGVPSLSAAYASVKKSELPMATTTMNIVQRLGGPTLTTLVATFLAWRLQAAPAGGAAFVGAFGVLCGIQALVVMAALRLPMRIEHAE